MLIKLKKISKNVFTESNTFKKNHIQIGSEYTKHEI